MIDRNCTNKIAGKFVAIIINTETPGGEDDISPLGTDDEREDTEAARSTEEAAGSESDSDGEVTVQIRKMAQQKQKERRKIIEQGRREAQPFPPYTGLRISYREPSWEEAVDDERSPPRARMTPRDRQRRGAYQEIREQRNLVLTHS